MSDDNLERDPTLVRLLAASSRDEPPAALDAAILAAARREVHAGPQAVGGGGGASAPPLRAGHVKRNWYVPVSIAAVLVMSVSLVRLMHEEKGDELAQPPASSRPLPKAASLPAPATEPAAASPAKPDTMLRDTTPSTPKLEEENRAAPPKAADTPTAPEAYAELAKKQRAEKSESAADGAAAMGGTTMGRAHRDQAPDVAPRELGSAGGAAAAKAAPGAASGMTRSVPAPAPAPAPAPVQRAEPFPASREREAPAVASAPATPAPAAAPPPPVRDAVEARPRSDGDRSLTRGTVAEAPAISTAPVVPEAKVLAAPRRAGPADDALAQSAPAQAERRAMAPPPPPAKMAPLPPAKPAATAPRLVVWRGLEDQSPEKWLERLAEFRRDNRQADADELLAEFRRRFPDHPASAR